MCSFWADLAFAACDELWGLNGTRSASLRLTGVDSWERISRWVDSPIAVWWAATFSIAKLALINVPPSIRRLIQDRRTASILNLRWWWIYAISETISWRKVFRRLKPPFISGERNFLCKRLSFHSGLGWIYLFIGLISLTLCWKIFRRTSRPWASLSDVTMRSYFVNYSLRLQIAAVLIQQV